MWPSLLLDECVSPNMSDPLWAEGIDNYSARDRGLCRSGDHSIFARAIEEDRAVVTINDAHFRKLAARAEKHPGVIVIPSGGNRDEQFDWVMKAIEWAVAENAVLPHFKNRIVYVAEDGTVTAETVHLLRASQAKDVG